MVLNASLQSSNTIKIRQDLRKTLMGEIFCSINETEDRNVKHVII